MATSLKSQGNTAYQARKFEVAVTYYTRAIEVAVTPEAVFYSNRAACRLLTYQSMTVGLLNHRLRELLSTESRLGGERLWGGPQIGPYVYQGSESSSHGIRSSRKG